MEQAIRDFAKQFSFEPTVENGDALAKYHPATGWRAVVAGMGGSHLAADLYLALFPNAPVSVHRSYGLPPVRSGNGLDLTLYIASSYSGNTEETLDFAQAAVKAGKLVAVISVGGKLAEFARANKLPFIQLPATGIQPRSALGFSVIALARMLSDQAALDTFRNMATVLKPDEFETEGAELAARLSGRVPVIYASDRNEALAYNWKIKFNETGKIPAFYNVVPECNHNELAGMDVLPTTAPLSERLAFVFLEDAEDHPRIVRRMAVMEQLYAARGLSVVHMPLSGAHRPERLFRSLLLADWAALKTAQSYRAEPDQVAIIESFKQLIG